MKICFVMDALFSMGGEQRVCTVLANELTKLGHQISIYSFEDASAENREAYGLDKDVKVFYLNRSEYSISTKMTWERIPTAILRKLSLKAKLHRCKWLGRAFSWAYYPFSVRKKWYSLFTQCDADVIVGLALNAFPLACISKKLKSKVIGWQHTSYEAYFQNPDLYLWKRENVLQYLIPKLDDYVVLKERDKVQYEKELGITVRVIPNLLSFKSNKKSLLDKKIFLGVGRCEKVKGFDLLIKSFGMIADKIPEWDLYIVGDGCDKEKLKEMITEYRLENRVFLQETTNNIQQYYLNASVFTLSSRYEGLPLVVLEAMEMGLPVIAYDIPAIKNIIDNACNGFVVEVGNYAAYAEKMLYLAEHADIRRRMADKAIQSMERYDNGEIVSEWVSLFRK